MEKIVYQKTDHERLDVFMADLLAVSRSQVQKMIKEGHILLNGIKVKAGMLLNDGDLITYEQLTSEDIDIKAQDIPLNIVYEDDDLIVINKPKGMVTHPAVGNYENTLVNALLYHFKELSDVGGELRPGIVHRLDKDTSGLLVVAKNNESHHFLSKQLEDKTCFRRYIALVYGEIANDEGVIDAPIGRDKHNRQLMAVSDQNAKPALTLFKVVKRYHALSLVDIELKTGRTHQIRAHFKYINHPVFNDHKYTKRKMLDDTGQFLHAYYLSFIHPKTKERMHFFCDLPAYFQAYLLSLDPSFNALEYLRKKRSEYERKL